MNEPLPVVSRAQSPEVSFSRIGIMGLGLIGGSLALAIKRALPTVMVIGVDRKPVIERAIVGHAIDVGADDPGMVGGAELVVLAAPLGVNATLLEELPGLIAGEAVITDVGGAKRTIAAAARALPTRLSFVGGHPIAGAAEGGFEHARADLFVRRPWVLCAPESASLRRVTELVEAIGAKPVRMPAEEHDHLLAFLSHLPQVTASALMHVVGEAIGAEGLTLAGPGLRDTTRLASSPADVWKPVLSANADEIRPALEKLIEILRELKDDLEHGQTVDKVFESARRWRAAREGGEP